MRSDSLIAETTFTSTRSGFVALAKQLEPASGNSEPQRLCVWCQAMWTPINQHQNVTNTRRISYERASHWQPMRHSNRFVRRAFGLTASPSTAPCLLLWFGEYNLIYYKLFADINFSEAIIHRACQIGTRGICFRMCRPSATPCATACNIHSQARFCDNSNENASKSNLICNA